MVGACRFGCSVLPERWEGDFACFDSFLPDGPLHQGVPPRFDGASFPAAQQLHTLLASAAPAGQLPPSITLVGFSKAGLVLRQVGLLQYRRRPFVERWVASSLCLCLDPVGHPCQCSCALQVVEELAAWQQAAGTACAVCSWHALRQQQQAPREWEVLARMQELHWLDAGANTKGAVYPATQHVIAPLARRCPAHQLRLRLHGTPRQWHDPLRPWLGQEKEGMLAACHAAGVACQARTYMQGQPASLEMHFAVIQAFDPT